MPFERAQLGAPRHAMSLRERNTLAGVVAAHEDGQVLLPPTHSRIERLRIHNPSSSRIERGGVLGLGASPVCNSDTPEWRFKELNVAAGEVPDITRHLTRWGIVAGDIQPHECGPLVLNGEAFVRVIVRDTAHECIQPRHDDPTFAVTCPNSIARIQWLEDSRDREPYDWRWAKVLIDQSATFFVEGFTTAGLSPATLGTTSAAADFTVDIDADLETLTASTAVFTDGPQWDDADGVFVDLLTAGPGNDTLTVRLYRLDDTHALIDPRADHTAVGVIGRWLTKTFTPRTIGVRIREQRGNAYVRTPHILTAESVDQSLSIPAGTRVVLVPWTIDRWRILWAECTPQLMVANASQRLL